MSAIDDFLTQIKSLYTRFTTDTAQPKAQKFNTSFHGGNCNTYSDLLLGKFDPDDIKTYPINEIKKSGRFTPLERKLEYRRRGKSPSGVIDGEYNDCYRENDEYNDAYRDWDADA